MGAATGFYRGTRAEDLCTPVNGYRLTLYGYKEKSIQPKNYGTYNSYTSISAGLSRWRFPKKLPCIQGY